MRYRIAFEFFVFLVLAIITAWSWEATNFSWVKSDNDELLCGMSPPNKTIKGVPSRALCASSCFQDCPSPCQAVNYWKNSKLCQHFHYIPCSYAVQQDCANYQVTTVELYSFRNEHCRNIMQLFLHRNLLSTYEMYI